VVAARLVHQGVVGERKDAGTSLEEEEAWSQGLAVAAAGEVDRERRIASHCRRDNHRAHGPESDSVGEDRQRGLERRLELGKRRA
jgi:hypothetical protein